MNDEDKSKQQLIEELHAMQAVYDDIVSTSSTLIGTQSRLQSMMHNVSDAVIMFGADGTVETFNRAAERIFGYTEVERLYKTLEDIIPCPSGFGADIPGFLNNYCENESDQYGNPITGICKDGTRRLFLCSTAIISSTDMLLFDDSGDSDTEFDSGDNPVEYDAFFCILHDVTERKRIDTELRRHQEDLEGLVDEKTAELRIAVEAAESANIIKTEFLANTSHELRSPMHSILSFADLGRQKAHKASPEKLEKYFSRIHDSGERLLKMINNLLDLSKMEAGRMVYQKQDTDLLALVSAIAVEFEIMARDKGVALDIEPPAADTTVHCDAERIGQIIRNLISNALKFTPEGKSIQIRFAPAELAAGRRQTDRGVTPGLAISVVDQGMGIPEAELELVFDKFAQSSKTKSGAGGTGLGLAICREIAIAHGGRITAANNPGEGANFTFVIPLHAIAEGQQPAAEQFCPPASAPRKAVG